MHTCPKCGGRGYLEVYNYVAGGVCFCCNGKGTVDRKPSEPKVRKQLTPEQKLAKVAKQTQAIIDSELAEAIKWANGCGVTGSTILATYAKQRDNVKTVAEARLYNHMVHTACHRIESINYAIRSAITADCNHWSDQTYSAD